MEVYYISLTQIGIAEESFNMLRAPYCVTPQLPWACPCSFTSQREGLVPIPDPLPSFKQHQNEDPSTD